MNIRNNKYLVQKLSYYLVIFTYTEALLVKQLFYYVYYDNTTYSSAICKEPQNMLAYEVSTRFRKYPLINCTA